MDYKKKYEDALERARQVHTTNVDENKKSIEYIFPELKESEDERIRKWLIEAMNYLSEESTFFLEVPKDEVIAWLEKQGEQKTVDKVEPNWSEEDEMMLETVFDKIGDLGTGEMCKEWLKSLKKRMKGE